MVEDCSDTFADILDGDKAGVTGCSVIKDFTFPQDQALTQERFRALQVGDCDTVSSKKTLRTLSGGRVDIYLEACLIRDADGEPSYVIDAIWVDHDADTEARISEFEAMIENLRTQVASGHQIHIGPSAGGDVVGHDKAMNQPAVWMVMALLFGGLSVVVVLAGIAILVAQWASK